MNLLYIVLPSAVVLIVAYLVYGRVGGAVSTRSEPENAGLRSEGRPRLRADCCRFALPTALLGHRCRWSHRGADPGGPDLWLAAGLDLDSGRLDLDRRRPRFCGPGRVDSAQSPLDRRSRPRSHEPAVVPLVPVVHLDRPRLYHRRVHRYHGVVVCRQAQRRGRGASVAGQSPRRRCST